MKPLSSILYTLFYPRKKKEFKRVQKHLDQLNLSHQFKAKDYYHELLTNSLFALKFFLSKKTCFNHKQIDVQNYQIYLEALKKDQPLLVLSIHQGSFELLHQVLEQKNKTVHTMTAPFGWDKIDQLIRKLRSRPNLKMNYPNELKEVLRFVISKNHVLALLMDQGKGEPSDTINILNHHLSIYLALPKLLIKKNTNIIFHRTWREKINGKDIHIIRFEKFIENSKQNPITKEILLKEAEKHINKCIIEHPDQWVWSYPKLNFRKI